MRHQDAAASVVFPGKMLSVPANRLKARGKIMRCFKLFIAAAIALLAAFTRPARAGAELADARR